MLIIRTMSHRRAKGQALAEYLLTVAILSLVFWAGLSAWSQALGQAEAQEAWYCFLPTP